MDKIIFDEEDLSVTYEKLFLYALEQRNLHYKDYKTMWLCHKNGYCTINVEIEFDE